MSRNWYSTPSLISLATLAATIWLWNLSDIHPRAYAGFNSDIAAIPTPTPQLSCKQLYEQRQVDEFINRCTVEERVHIYSLDPFRPRFIIAAAGEPVEEARLLRLIRQLPSAEQVLGLSPSNATALCADGTYSWSTSRPGTCSYHGGVRQWLPLDKKP